MPAALITGVTGQDGSYLAELLIDKGWQVVGTVRGETSADEQDVPLGVTATTLDLADTAATSALVAELRPDLVVNLAAISSVAASWADPLTTGRVSGLGVATLLDACWKLKDGGHEVRFVQASSAEIFAGSGVSPQNESTPIVPTNPYGAAKAFAHHLVGVYRERGLHASAAILYNHESPRRPPAFVTRKITQAAAEIAVGRRDSLELGNLSARRDWGWAPDYVDAIERIAAAETPRDYVVATGVAHSVAEFVQAAFAAAGVDDWESRVRTNDQFTRPGDAAVQLGDSSRIRNDLGWKPTLSFAEIVKEMVDHDLRQLSDGSQR